MSLTADEFRDIVLSLNGASEGAHMGHPDFRANGRVFASLHADDVTANLKLTPEEQATLMREQPRMFTPAAGAWGRQGWTVVPLAAASEAPVRGAAMLAWQNVTSLPPGRSAAKGTVKARIVRAAKAARPRRKP